jgi:hypothetical protein
MLILNPSAPALDVGGSIRVNNRPIISATLGEYQCSLSVAPQGPVLAAGIRFAFRYGGANLCLVEKIIFDGAGVTTALTAGQAFTWQAIARRSYTVSDATGGTAATLTTNNCKLRTSYATTGVSSIHIATAAAVLSGGTSTPDAQPFGSVTAGLAGAGTFMGEATLFDGYEVGHPQIFAQNEGFSINLLTASPAAGTIGYGFTVKWTEVTPAEWA